MSISSHSLGFVRAIHVRASLDHQVSDPRTLRRRDNTDGRNSFKSIFFNRETASIRCGAGNATTAQIHRNSGGKGRDPR